MIFNLGFRSSVVKFCQTGVTLNCHFAKLINQMDLDLILWHNLPISGHDLPFTLQYSLEILQHF